MRRRTLFVVISLLPFLSNCVRRRTTAEPYNEAVHVLVTNNYSQPMEVFVGQAGATHRLGTVHPGMEGRFEVPQGMIDNGMVTFYAYPTVDARQVAQPGQLLLVRGQVVEFVIGNPLYNSTITVHE